MAEHIGEIIERVDSALANTGYQWLLRSDLSRAYFANIYSAAYLADATRVYASSAAEALSTCFKIWQAKQDARKAAEAFVQ